MSGGRHHLERRAARSAGWRRGRPPARRAGPVATGRPTGSRTGTGRPPRRRAPRWRWPRRPGRSPTARTRRGTAAGRRRPRPPPTRWAARPSTARTPCRASRLGRWCAGACRSPGTGCPTRTAPARAPARRRPAGGRRPCIHGAGSTPAMAQNVGARSTCPTGSCTTAGATPAEGAGRHTKGSRISASVWYGPL